MVFILLHAFTAFFRVLSGTCAPLRSFQFWAGFDGLESESKAFVGLTTTKQRQVQSPSIEGSVR